MKYPKSSFVFLLAFLLLLIPISSEINQFEGVTITIETSSPGNPPIVTDLGGGIMNYSMVRTEYIEPFPWSWDPEHILFWNVEFTNDTEVDYYFFNSTYGSLDGLNGSFTPLFTALETSVASEPEFLLWEACNPNNLEDFGHNVSCWIEDDSGTRSEVFTKLFKYHNETVGTSPEELEFTATPEKSVVNNKEQMVIDFDISDPDGPRTYQIEYTCNVSYFDFMCSEFITPSQATFTPIINSGPPQWAAGRYYDFDFNLSIWEGSVMVDTINASAMVYATSPPENGTCDYIWIGPDNISEKYVYNVTCADWEDDLDGNGPFLYRAISKTEKEYLEQYPEEYWTAGTFESEFQLLLDDTQLGEYWIRVFDSHGGYTEVYLGNLDGDNPIPGVPGFPICVIFLAIVPICVGIYLKTKKSL